MTPTLLPSLSPQLLPPLQGPVGEFQRFDLCAFLRYPSRIDTSRSHRLSANILPTACHIYQYRTV